MREALMLDKTQIKSVAIIGFNFLVLNEIMFLCIGGSYTVLFHLTLYMSLGKTYIDLLEKVLRSTFGLQQLWEYLYEKFINLPDYLHSLWGKFKYGMVNFLDLDVFLILARFVPIGDWIIYQEPDWLGNNPLSRAIFKKNSTTIDRLLDGRVSEKVISQFILAEGDSGFSAILRLPDNFKPDEAAIILEKMLIIVAPERRLPLLLNIKTHWGLPYLFELTGKFFQKYLDVIMKVLPQKDHFEFINQRFGGRTFLMYIISPRWKDNIGPENVIRYIPKEYLLPYLNTVDESSDTALTLCADYEAAERMEYILKLIPDDEKKSYFELNNQGQKALVIAHAKGNWRTKEILQKHGIVLSEDYKHVKKKDLTILYDKWRQDEGFRKAHGQYPFEILDGKFNWNEKCDLQKIQTAYRKKMLIFHPDRNRTLEANEESQKINAAFEYYKNPHARIKYNLPS